MERKPMTWYTADHHLGETRLAILDRPFTSTEKMFEEILANHNNVIEPTDEVVFVGDIVSLKAENPKEWLKRVALFNGRKTLIRGNHDRQFTDDELKPYFEQIIAEGDGIEREIEGIPCYITHYPTRSHVDRFNIVGHIHTAWKFQLNMLNVGVDVWHYRPVPPSKIAANFQSIHDFYDEDVFCANFHTNEAYIGLRGKKGTYYIGDDNK